MRITRLIRRLLAARPFDPCEREPASLRQMYRGMPPKMRAWFWFYVVWSTVFLFMAFGPEA